MSNLISPDLFGSWLKDDSELAVLDIREAEAYGKGAPLYAANLPSGRVAAEVERLLPRKSIRTVLVDGGDGSAARLVERLRAEGWSGLVALAGGLPAWLAQVREPRPTFDASGLDFSLAVLYRTNTPWITLQELRALRAKGQPVVLLDARSPAEFERGHVPGAINVSGADLIATFDAVVPSPDAQVVVACAGLPRAILGAQTLIEAGVPNPVSYLHNAKGEGLVEAGRRGAPAVADAADPASAEARLVKLTEGDGFARIDRATALAWRDDPDRTTYLIDVRPADDFAAGHVPGSVSLLGGQLFAVSYRNIPVRGARVVLIDDERGLRAGVTAHWLKQQRRTFEIALLLHSFGRQTQSLEMTRLQQKAPVAAG